MCAREGLVVVEISKCFEKMYSGDEKAILEGLLSDGMLPRANAIKVKVFVPQPCTSHVESICLLKRR